MLRICRWRRIFTVLGEARHDAEEYYDRIEEFAASPGADVRRNPLPNARFSSAGRRVVLCQRKDHDDWQECAKYSTAPATETTQHSPMGKPY